MLGLGQIHEHAHHQHRHQRVGTAQRLGYRGDPIGNLHVGDGQRDHEQIRVERHRAEEALADGAQQCAAGKPFGVAILGLFVRQGGNRTGVLFGKCFAGLNMQQLLGEHIGAGGHHHAVADIEHRSRHHRARTPE